MSQETILIADDSEINRAVLRSLFENKYNLLEAENGEQALMLLRQYSDAVTVVLLDLVMPGKDGYEVLEEMRHDNLLYHIPVIVITADNSADSKVRVFELGASDIIAKPFEPDVVKCRVQNIIELGSYRRNLEKLVKEQSARAQETSAAVIDMLSSVIEYRSLESGQHIRRIRMFTKILLEEVAKNYQEYGLDDRKIQLITDASSMHDIGKIAIPDSILNKPSRLTSQEFEVMKTHTIKGCEILMGLDKLQDQEYLQYAYNICRHHHERWDGNGYPDGLKENSIPICAQVVAIADCYDALTTDRVYKKAIPQGQAFSMILNGECGVFSPRLLECFKNVRKAFVKLSKEYADGLIDYANRKTQPLPERPVWDIAYEAQEQGQLKYFTLLRYLDSTVLEVDLNTGVYHLVYLADQNFAILRSGNNFEESIKLLAETAVHPDDREEMLHILDDYIQEIFDEGLTRRDRKYRILDNDTDNSTWYKASVLRINMENPREHKVLIIWKKENETKSLTKPEKVSGLNLFMNSDIFEQLIGGIHKCRCDNNFTLIQVNRAFTNLVGYSSQELSEKFNNSYMALVHPSDREKVFEQFRRQRNFGNIMELEYRLVAKNGNIVWVCDHCMLTVENGKEFVYCILLDITRSRQAEEDLRLSLERHNVIMKQTNDILFEWDIQKDELYFSTNWEKQYGYIPITSNVRTEIPKASHINPDDIPAFVDLMDSVTAGVSYKEAEFRIADAEGKYRWRKARATTQFDTDGKPVKAIGIMVDIDSQKQVSVELENRVSHDTLTGLYNRAYIQEYIENYLLNIDSNEISALMILDVDDFKQINDQYGHMFGDAVLVEMSDKITGLCRNEDTVARIGGDEFLIFMPNIQNEENAKCQANSIISSLQELLIDNLGKSSFSSSIGITFAKDSQLNFQQLFNRADRALYRAKAAGKNQFKCYHKSMEHGPIGTLTSINQVRRTEIDSDHPQQWSLSNIVIKTFDILYNTKHAEQAIQSILALIGKTFGASRTYIFENSKSGEYCNNTFEWCAKDADPQIELLQNIPYVAEGKDYRNNFNENGIFYCQNIENLNKWERSLLEEQKILSTLQCAILDGDEFKGFVGFDDCNIHRLWTKEQIEALTFVGRLLSIFLLKKRAETSLESLENLHSISLHENKEK